jgi:thymidylate kinase
VTPRVTILLELPAEEGAERQRAAAKDRDRMEREEAAFHARVAAGYLELAASVREWSGWTPAARWRRFTSGC